MYLNETLKCNEIYTETQSINILWSGVRGVVALFVCVYVSMYVYISGMLVKIVVKYISL